MGVTYDIELPGCTPTPLAAYLRALAVLRLVSEQVDGDAVGWWGNEVFHLQSVLDENGLIRFLTEEYIPTPMIAPWNGGSGFYPKDSAEALLAIRDSTSLRFLQYSETIDTAMVILRSMGLEERPKDEKKAQLLAKCRSEFPDIALDWLDAAVVLTGDALRFPPLLGTGGNDGRLEFTNNFMQRLLDVINPHSGNGTEGSKRWLSGMLFGRSTNGLVKAAIGQFSPGGAGGPNARAGFERESLVNPWEFVLMMEGALVFASAATKRLDVSRQASLSYPFTVAASGVGHGGLSEHDESTARAEIWMPLWRQRMTFRELNHIFHEGRAQVNGRAARNGVDFVRACAALGVDRGIEGFQRYGFLMRSGRTYLAVPLNRIVVRRQAQADILNELEHSGWMDSLRSYAKNDASNEFAAAVRNLEQAMFDLCQHPGRYRVQQILIAVGRIERLLVKRPAARENVRPLLLRSREWLEQADDGSDEFALACGIAGLYSPNLPNIKSYFSPVKPRNSGQWDVTVSPRVVWGSGNLTTNLYELIRRRLLDAGSASKSDSTENVDEIGTERTSARSSGFAPGYVRESPTREYEDRENKIRARMDKPFSGWVTVPLSSVLAFLRGYVDERKIQDLLWGLLSLSQFSTIKGWKLKERSPNRVEWIPWGYAVSKVIATPNAELARLYNKSERMAPGQFRETTERGNDDIHSSRDSRKALSNVEIPFSQNLLETLVSGGDLAVNRASVIAERRLAASGVGLVFPERGQVASPGMDGRRVAAALTFPLSLMDTRRLLEKIAEADSRNQG